MGCLALANLSQLSHLYPDRNDLLFFAQTTFVEPFAVMFLGLFLMTLSVHFLFGYLYVSSVRIGTLIHPKSWTQLFQVLLYHNETVSELFESLSILQIIFN